MLGVWAMRATFVALAMCLLAGCAAGPRIDTSYTSQGQDDRVQFLIIHFTSDDFPTSLKLLPKGR